MQVVMRNKESTLPGLKIYPQIVLLIASENSWRLSLNPPKLVHPMHLLKFSQPTLLVNCVGHDVHDRYINA